LHRYVAFIDQLPPGLRRDPRRAAVQRYKRHLFAGTHHAGAIKAEVVKAGRGGGDLGPGPLQSPTGNE
jgi:hypothetical protein